MAASTTNPVAAMRSFPKSDDFAVMLGLKQSQVGTPAARSEQHKIDIMNLLFIPRLHMEHPLQQDVVFSRFAALYLPALVQRYLRPPTPSSNPLWHRSIAVSDFPLANAYGYMLVHLNGNPYFNKYFRLAANRGVRQEIVVTLLRRLDERTVDWATRMDQPVSTDIKGKGVEREPTASEGQGGIAVQSMIHDFCQLLGSLLIFESEEAVQDVSRSPEAKHILPFLDWWDTRFGSCKKDMDSAASESKEKEKERQAVIPWPAATLKMVLTNGADERERQALRHARAQKGGIGQCAHAGCDHRVAEDGGALLQCSQCGTVRYCSEEHQRAAWKHPKVLHKEMCHRPVF